MLLMRTEQVFDPSSTHPPPARRREDIERELAELSAQVDAAKHRQLMLIHEADVEGCWAHTGARSCVDWLGWRIGMTAGTAREHLRVARALKKLPLIDAEMERGKLSYSKVRALTRVATPENEETLSDMALNSTAAMLERICRGVKLASRDEDGELIAAPEPERWVNSRWEGDGMTRVTAVLSADEAELLMETLRSVRETMKSDESEAEPSLADALVHVAEQAATEKKVQEAQTRTTGGDAQMVVLHLRESMLGDGVVTQLEDGSRVSAETFRRVACDASLLPVLEGELGQVLNVGRKTRSIPPAVRRAVEAKHGRCCSFPGCTSTRFIHFHHVQHWAHGGDTSARNLLPLCSFHHRLVHEGGWTVQYDGAGAPEFRHPEGRPLPPWMTMPSTPPDVIERMREAHAVFDIDEDTGLCDWDGQPLDLYACVDAVCPIEDRPFSAAEYYAEHGFGTERADASEPPAEALQILERMIAQSGMADGERARRLRERLRERAREATALQH